MAPSAIALDRERVLHDPTLRGRELITVYTALIDTWLAGLYADAIGDRPGVALVATGGYGRAELTPRSDLDLLLLHDGSVTDADAQRLWYPVWDAGLKLGHAVRTTAETMRLASNDLATATALLSVRTLAGSADMGGELGASAVAAWRKGSKRWLAELAVSVETRHESAGQVPFDLEPDLKEGRGGLRDVHAMTWASVGDERLANIDVGGLTEHYDTLLDVRVELHRVTGRAGDRLFLQEQDEVAERLGDADADVLMGRIAEASRAIAWASDECWYDIRRRSSGGFLRRPQRPKLVGDDVEVAEGRAELTSSEGTDASAVLRVAVAAAQQHVRIGRRTLQQLREAPALSDPWPETARELFVTLLQCGQSAIDVIETLDIADQWCRLIPEWAPNRSRPQRNAYHHFTVDRHLLECVAQAAKLVERVDRPDLLVLGALCHDIGKGYPGDHAIVGIDLAAAVCRRMGLPENDIETVRVMVEHHLLLPDVATRRDLDDPATIRSVAEQVGTVDRLRLLEALTEADSIATGPSAWSAWKAGLLATLVERVAHVIEGGDVTEVTTATASTAHRDLLAVGLAEQRLVVDARGDHLLLVCPDRPALFSRVAAVLALNGLDVIEASATSEQGMAIDDFRVSSAFSRDIPWSKVERDLERALMGRLALEPRLAERARSYRTRPTSAMALEPLVRVLDEASDDATVIEVVGPDRVGLLYRLTRALADLDLDILSAKVATIGADVVDAFYVRDRSGAKVTEVADLAEIETALLHVLLGDPR